MRFRKFLSIAAILCALPALAREQPKPLPVAPAAAALPVMVPPPAVARPAASPAPAVPALQTKVFAVADLVIPIPDFALPDYASKPAAPAVPQKPSVEAGSTHLIRLVQSTVRPESWQVAGGRGKMEFFDIGCTLVVENTPEVVAEVAALLDGLRRMQDVSVGIELNVVKVPAGFCARHRVSTAGDELLTERELGLLLEVAQGHPTATITRFPKVTAFDGQTVNLKNGDTEFFVTSAEAVKVQGETVIIPKNTSVFLGDALTLCGRLTADEKSVNLRASLTRTTLVGNVELTPIVTQVTPVFEGGSKGKPVSLTQYLQAPDFKTQKLEVAAVVPGGRTLVLGGWKEAADAKPDPARGKNAASWVKKGEPATCEVVVLATVRVIKTRPDVAPAPRAASARWNEVVKVKNVAAADAATALQEYATKHFKGLERSVVVIAEPVANTVLISALPDDLKQIKKILAALDREPEQVVVQALVLEVPHGFAKRAGLGGDATGGRAATLTPREMALFTELVRKEKALGTCDVLSRPQIQVCDNQTGYVQVGQQSPVCSGVEVVPVGFLSVPVPKVIYALDGITMRVTPRITLDGKAALLRTEVEVASAGGTVKVGETESAVINSQKIEKTAQVAFGDTLVLSGGCRKVERRSDNGGMVAVTSEQIETLVVVTPHRVRSEAENARILAEEAQKLKWCLPATGWFTK